MGEGDAVTAELVASGIGLGLWLVALVSFSSSIGRG
jgi:hypothetical protein